MKMNEGDLPDYATSGYYWLNIKNRPTDGKDWFGIALVCTDIEEDQIYRFIHFPGHEEPYDWKTDSVNIVGWSGPVEEPEYE